MKPIIAAILARLDTLETAVLGRPRQRLTKADLAKQEGTSTRTVDRRWRVERKLPPPDDIINGRLYWWSDSIERYRRRTPDTAEARAARNPKLKLHNKPALSEI
jgi:hypothetical protein